MQTKSDAEKCIVQLHNSMTLPVSDIYSSYCRCTMFTTYSVCLCLCIYLSVCVCVCVSARVQITVYVKSFDFRERKVLRLHNLKKSLTPCSTQGMLFFHTNIFHVITSTFFINHETLLPY